jgi:hypothetical protein
VGRGWVLLMEASVVVIGIDDELLIAKFRTSIRSPRFGAGRESFIVFT